MGKGNNLNATAEPGEPLHGCPTQPVTNSVWWSWSGLPNGLVTIVNTNSALNGIIDVYQITTNKPGCTAPPSGLLDWWPANLDANDIIGGLNGTLLNGPTWATGKFGKALNFPAGRSVVNVGAKASLANLNRTGFSVTAWINLRSGGSLGRIVDKDDNSIGWFLKMSSATTVQFVSDNGGPSRTSSGAIGANTWQHVAATWTGGTAASTAHVYVNGNPADGAGVDGVGSPGDDSGTPLSIGNRATALDRGFDGLIDDLRIYPRVLSAAEIKTLAMATAP